VAALYTLLQKERPATPTRASGQKRIDWRVLSLGLILLIHSRTSRYRPLNGSSIAQQLEVPWVWTRACARKPMRSDTPSPSFAATAAAFLARICSPTSQPLWSRSRAAITGEGLVAFVVRSGGDLNAGFRSGREQSFGGIRRPRGERFVEITFSVDPGHQNSFELRPATTFRTSKPRFLDCEIRGASQSHQRAPFLDERLQSLDAILTEAAAVFRRKSLRPGLAHRSFRRTAHRSNRAARIITSYLPLRAPFLISASIRWHRGN